MPAWMWIVIVGAAALFLLLMFQRPIKRWIEFPREGVTQKGEMAPPNEMTVDEPRCPICGKGILADISYTGGTRDEDGAPVQMPESRQLTRYSCGHTEPGARLETANANALDVERRESRDTV